MQKMRSTHSGFGPIKIKIFVNWLITDVQAKFLYTVTSK